MTFISHLMNESFALYCIALHCTVLYYIILFAPTDRVSYVPVFFLVDHPCSNNNGNCTHLCLMKPSGYQCACPDDDGANCSASYVNYCMLHPCQNGGTCEVIGNDHQCTCPGFYGGKDCSVDLSKLYFEHRRLRKPEIQVRSPPSHRLTLTKHSALSIQHLLKAKRIIQLLPIPLYRGLHLSRDIGGKCLL